MEKSESYGCKVDSWGPQLPSASTDVHDDQKWRLGEFQKVDRDTGNIKLKMASTYPLQGKDINEKKLISQLKVDWPFLFANEHLLAHYDKLVDGMQSSKSLVVAMQEGPAVVLK